MEKKRVIKVGGSFAPPLSAAKLAEYRTLASKSDDRRVRDVMLLLCKMVEVFQETPASTLNGSVGPTGLGVVIPLEAAEVDRIDAVVPWDYECDAYQNLFETIPTDSNLRTPAFHLLWYAKELTVDREPMTNDKL